MRAGARLDVSAVAAAIEEADGLASIRSEDLVVNRTTTPKVGIRMLFGGQKKGFCVL